MGLAQQFDGQEMDALNEWLDVRISSNQGDSHPQSAGSRKATSRAKSIGGGRRMTLPDGTVVEEAPDGSLRIPAPSTNLAAPPSRKKRPSVVDDYKVQPIGGDGMASEVNRIRQQMHKEWRLRADNANARPFTNYAKQDIQNLMQSGEGSGMLNKIIGNVPLANQVRNYAHMAETASAGPAGAVVIGAVVLQKLQEFDQKLADMATERQQQRHPGLMGVRRREDANAVAGDIQALRESKSAILDVMADLPAALLPGNTTDGMFSRTYTEVSRALSGAGNANALKEIDRRQQRAANDLNIDSAGSFHGWKREPLHGG